MLDFIRIACAVPAVQIGNVDANIENICSMLDRADAMKADVVVFPELSLTGYTCGDLFFQNRLQMAAKSGLAAVAAHSEACPELTAVVGLPVLLDGQLYNCAAVVQNGTVLALIPKTFLPNYNEFGEKRWFASSADLLRDCVTAQELGLRGDYSVPVSAEITIDMGEVVLGVELCEDLWAPVAPSAMLAMSGAEVIVNPAATNQLAGKGRKNRLLVQQQSSSCCCVYALCSAGMGESTQDLVYSGQSIIAQGGKILAENEKLTDGDYLLVTDADLGMIRADRCRRNTFRDAAAYYGARAKSVCTGRKTLRSDGTRYPVSKLPFVPSREETRLERCKEIFQIQVAGLKHRLSTIHANAVIGISGGLDSTLALLVAVEAMRQLGRPMTDVYGVTMPCFGTSDRTYRNALELMQILGISSKEINIQNAVNTHFADIGHDPQVHDTTYENSQARERTQILMDYAGQVGGIVVGTGDMSELALGWCTYNGDHMSMYGVNGSVPKTLIRWIVDTVSREPEFAAAAPVLQDILDTPISPELLPPDAQGKISQQTEDIVGPYALHDFFLYHMLRYGSSPEKIYNLACRAFEKEFDSAVVKKWLLTFYRRFFSQQFKRNCQPDGVKTGTVGIGPRGDLRMPSDACVALWLSQTEKL